MDISCSEEKIGKAVVRFAGIPNFTYEVRRTTNVLNPVWTVLHTTNAPANGVFEFTDSETPLPSPVYYRTKLH